MTLPGASRELSFGDPVLNTFAAASLNHLLRPAGWARDKLKAHAGKSFTIDAVPVASTLTIRDDGQLLPAAAGVEPAVTVRITPGVALRLAARDDSAWNAVAVTGDAALAETLGYVFRNLRWDVEEDLSRVIGDIAAHRAVETGKALDRWARATVDHLGRNVADYYTYEQPLVVNRRDVESFNRDVDTLRDDLARFEQRLARLAARRA